MGWFDSIARVLSGAFNRGGHDQTPTPSNDAPVPQTRQPGNMYSPTGAADAGHVQPAASGLENAAHSAADYQRLRAQLAAQQQALGPEPPGPRPPRPPVYIPMQQSPDGTQAPVRLPQQRINGEDIPTPDPAANGAPHTTLGGRVGSDGRTYRQSATFPGGSWPSADGKDVPWGRVDWTDHGRPQDHPDPHMHEFNWQQDPNQRKDDPAPPRGDWRSGPQRPFRT
jgi:hypothetical protein